MHCTKHSTEFLHTCTCTQSKECTMHYVELHCMKDFQTGSHQNYADVISKYILCHKFIFVFSGYKKYQIKIALIKKSSFAMYIVFIRKK